jgi:REP element-mobilizing transposase RayT
LANVPSFCDNPIVFFTTCTCQRRKILASLQCEQILREVWHRSADHDSWYVGHYIVMPDYVHFFARPAIDARPMADWVQMWKSVGSRQIAAALAIKQPIWQAEYSIVTFGRLKVTQQNGTTLSKTQSGQGSSWRLKRGLIAER